MAGEIENFGKKRNSNGFAERPGDAGRPKKGIHILNTKLKKLGYDEMNNQDYQSLIRTLINMKEKDFKDVFKNKDQYVLIKILAKGLTGDKNFENHEKLIDRMFGKAKQVTEEIGKGREVKLDKKDEELINSVLDNN